jgi:hypothetical protein
MAAGGGDRVHGGLTYTSTERGAQSGCDPGIFSCELSNSLTFVRLDGETAVVITAARRDVMSQYLVAIHHPDDFEPFSESEDTHRDISALNEQMKTAGVIVFVGGLAPVREAVSVRMKAQGNLATTDGPYIETKEHIGGFWVLECASRDDAVEWGRKAAIACSAPVEIRPFN